MSGKYIGKIEKNVRYEKMNKYPDFQLFIKKSSGSVRANLLTYNHL